MRPKKTRWVKCSPSERILKPHTKSNKVIILTLDEFEAVRLLVYEGLSQTEAAKQMHIHRSTVSRIASSARQKIVGALVKINALKIEGGCCKVVKEG